MDSTGESFEAIRAVLADRNNILTVKDLCELAGVSRSGYYNWVRSEKNRELREAKDRACLLYTSPSPRDSTSSRMPSSA